MRITSISHKDIIENPLGIVHDYNTVASWLGAKPSTVSFVLHNMHVVDKRAEFEDPNAQQLKIAIKKSKDKVRIVYQSRTALDFLQKRLLKEFNEFTEAIPNDHLWAYIPGKNPRNLPLHLSESGVIVHFDIVGYFDNIKFDHISHSLQAMGMSRQGANLTTRFCVVERNTAQGKVRSLQQGSAASSPLSNLVGYMYFDQAIMAWLESHSSDHMETQYHRYCDNIYLGLKGSVPMDFIQRFKEFVHGHMRSVGFATHAWNVTQNNNPKRAQKVLGIVVNHIPRVENEYFERVRSILFNACRFGLAAAASKFFENEGLPPSSEDVRFFNNEREVSTFLAKIKGRANYIGDVNPMHKAQLKKLILALDKMEAWRSGISNAARFGDVPAEIFDVLKGYRNHGEKPEAFLSRLYGKILISEVPRAA